MTRVTISEPVLRWALARSASPANIETKFTKLAEWMSGESRPTLRQLEKFAKATSTPFGYLFLHEPAEERLPIPYLRTIRYEPGQSPSPDMIETVWTMSRRQSWMRDYLIEQGHEPLEFVRSVGRTESPEHIGRDIRSVLGLMEGWASTQRTWTQALRELQRSIEGIGILLSINSVVGNNTHRKLDPTEFRGFVIVDEYAPLIFINSADGKAAQMFTLAHELAHVWLGNSAAFDLRELEPADDVTEKLCNRIAAEFLVPASELRQIWQSIRKGQKPYQIIARHFKVSEIVAARRALDLAFISRDEFLEFYHAYLEEESRISGTGPVFYPTQNLRLGRRFSEAVVRSVREGRILYREAYRLTGLHGITFERYAEHLGFGAIP